MDIFTVSFFGHREFSNPFEVDKKLAQLVRDIIMEKEYVEFLVGREGAFDLLAAAVIRSVTIPLELGNSSLTLVLPYMKSEYQNNTESFENYYDEIEICERSAKSHYKAAIGIRNRSMVDRSDLVVCCIEHPNGGAYQAVRYAEEKSVRIINVAS